MCARGCSSGSPRPAASAGPLPLCAVRSRTALPGPALPDPALPDPALPDPALPGPAPSGPRRPAEHFRTEHSQAAVLSRAERSRTERSRASTPGPGAGDPGNRWTTRLWAGHSDGLTAAARVVGPHAGCRTPGRCIRAGRPRHGLRTAAPAGLHRGMPRCGDPTGAIRLPPRADEPTAPRRRTGRRHAHPVRGGEVLRPAGRRGSHRPGRPRQDEASPRSPCPYGAYGIATRQVPQRGRTTPGMRRPRATRSRDRARRAAGGCHGLRRCST